MAAKNISQQRRLDNSDLNPFLETKSCSNNENMVLSMPGNIILNLIVSKTEFERLKEDLLKIKEIE